MDIYAKVSGRSMLNCSKASSCLMIVNDKAFDENTIIACCITARWCVCVHSELGNHNEEVCGQ